MKKDVIKLSLPAKLEYLVAPRLVVASLFGQEGFHLDDIEDAKSAVSEACLLLLPKEGEEADIILEAWKENGIHAIIGTTGTPSKSDTPEREFSMFLIEAVVDEVTYREEDGWTEYHLFKSKPMS